MYWYSQWLPPRRARMLLQLGIFIKARYSACFFYPISALLLHEKLHALHYATPLGRTLHIASFVFLVLSDAVRFWLGCHGNLNMQVFHLTAFLFLSICPMAPALVYFAYFADNILRFDTIAGSVLLALLAWEVAWALLVLSDLLRRETTRFLRLREAIKAQEMTESRDRAALVDTTTCINTSHNINRAC